MSMIYSVIESYRWKKDSIRNRLFEHFDENIELLERFDSRGNLLESKRFSPGGDGFFDLYWYGYQYDESGKEIGMLQRATEPREYYDGPGKHLKVKIPYSHHEYYCEFDGGIGSVVSKEYLSVDSLFDKTWEYDKKGKLIKETWRYPGFGSRVRLREYDKKGKLIGMILYDKDGELESKSIFKYDKSENLVEEKIYTFNYKVKVTSIRLEFLLPPVGGKDLEEKVYDGNIGIGTRLLKYRDDECLPDKGKEWMSVSERIYDSTHKIFIREWKYNERNNLTEERLSGPDFNIVVRKWKYKEDGDFFEEILYDPDGNIIERDPWRHLASRVRVTKYDERGNWIELHTGKFRRILYYD